MEVRIVDFFWSLPVAKIVRFGLVGCAGVVVDFGITFLIKEKLGLNKYLANSTGFYVAATNNFFLNRYWTFNSANPNVLLQYLQFMIIAIVGVALSNGIIWILYEKLNTNFYRAKGLSILVVMAWNFSVNSMVTFAE